MKSPAGFYYENPAILIFLQPFILIHTLSQVQWSHFVKFLLPSELIILAVLPILAVVPIFSRKKAIFNLLT